MRQLCYLIFLILFTQAIDTNAADSTANKCAGNWRRYTPAIRLGIGWQPKFYAETGIAFHRSYIKGHKAWADAFYGAVEWSSNMYGDRGFLLAGPKLGWEVYLFPFEAGLEAKYQSDGRNKDFVVTPKIGTGFFGKVNLMYGYNLSFNKYPFPGIGRHQFSLVVNFYRKGWFGRSKP